VKSEKLGIFSASSSAAKSAAVKNIDIDISKGDIDPALTLSVMVMVYQSNKTENPRKKVRMRKMTTENQQRACARTEL